MDPEQGSTEEGRVLSPGELELSEKEGVEQIDEGRFVVSPDGTQPNVSADIEAAKRAEAEAEVADPSAEPVDPGDRPPSMDRAAIRDWHDEQLFDSPCTYGYHLSLKAGDSVEHQTLHTDDVTMAFNNLLLWYARTIDTDLPPGAVLGILLADASVPVQYPPRVLEEFLMAHGLSTQDSIADLLDVVRDDEGIVFPPRTE